MDVAFEYKHADIVKLLLENGATGGDLNDAVKLLDLDVMRLLVSRGENVNEFEIDTLLCSLAYEGGAEEGSYWGDGETDGSEYEFDDIDDDATVDDDDDDDDDDSSVFDGALELAELSAVDCVPLEQLQAIQAALPPFEEEEDDDDDDSSDNEDDVDEDDTKNKRIMEIILF